MQTSTTLSRRICLKCREISSKRHASSRTVSERFAPVRGQYETTISNLGAEKDAPVLVIGTGKASSFHHGVGQKYGTNFVAGVAPGKGGRIFLGKPVYGSLKEAVRHEKPYCASVFVPLAGAAQAIIDCVEEEIPLIVAVAEGVPTLDQLRVQAALRTQDKSRVVGANCPGMILPHARFKIGIQPLAVHRPGIVGLAARSGTVSYELAAKTTELGLGQSAVFGLGGDPFPSTRTWEALAWMLEDSNTKVICLVGEIGGQMEEEAAHYLEEYKAANKPMKPVVGFIGGQQTLRGRLYGHSGAIWHEEKEKAASKMKVWQNAGIRVAEHLGQVGRLLSEAAAEIHTSKA